MNCPDTKTWELLSMDLLAEDQARSLRQHLSECAKCRPIWQQASQQHADLQGAFQMLDCNHDRRREQLLAMLPAQG